MHYGHFTKLHCQLRPACCIKTPSIHHLGLGNFSVSIFGVFILQGGLYFVLRLLIQHKSMCNKIHVLDTHNPPPPPPPPPQKKKKKKKIPPPPPPPNYSISCNKQVISDVCQNLEYQTTWGSSKVIWERDYVYSPPCVTTESTSC